MLDWVQLYDVLTRSFSSSIVIWQGHNLVPHIQWSFQHLMCQGKWFWNLSVILWHGRAYRTGISAPSQKDNTTVLWRQSLPQYLYSEPADLYVWRGRVPHSAPPRFQWSTEGTLTDEHSGGPPDRHVCECVSVRHAWKQLRKERNVEGKPGRKTNHAERDRSPRNHVSGCEGNHLQESISGSLVLKESQLSRRPHCGADENFTQSSEITDDF